MANFYNGDIQNYKNLKRDKNENIYKNACLEININEHIFNIIVNNSCFYKN